MRKYRSLTRTKGELMWGIVFPIAVILFFIILNIKPREQIEKEIKEAVNDGVIEIKSAWGQVVSYGSPLSNNQQKLLLVFADQKEINVLFSKTIKELEKMNNKVFIKYWLEPDQNVYYGEIVDPPPETK